MSTYKTKASQAQQEENEMEPHYLVRTENRDLKIKCTSIGEARKVLGTMPKKSVIEYVRKMGQMTVTTEVE